MNAKFEIAQHRLINHALSCLSRFGEQLSILCLRHGEKEHVMRLSSMASSQSAFCAFMIRAEFFQIYEIQQGRRRIDLQLPIRSVQSVLNRYNNKHLQSCELEVSEGEHECRLAIRLHGDNGTSKTHKLTYEVAPCLFPKDQASAMNHIVASPKTIQDLLDFFANKVNGEITMTCTERGCSLSSRGDEVADSRQRNILQTEVHVPKGSFQTYVIGQEVEMTFSLREFRAPVALADHLQCPLEMRFETAGYPLNMQVKVQGMTAQVFLATSEPDFPKLTNTNRSVSADTSSYTHAMPSLNGHVGLPNGHSNPAAQLPESDNSINLQPIFTRSQDDSRVEQNEIHQEQDLFRQYDDDQSAMGSQVPQATPMQETPLETSTLPTQPMESTPLPPPAESMQMTPSQPQPKEKEDAPQVVEEVEKEMGKSADTGFSSLWHERDTTFEEEEEARREEEGENEDDSLTLSENEEFVPGTQDGGSASNKRPRYNPLL
ncbi:uncharacterized protein FA14DRAFT_9688 [Meira miltonrushii]|uniref:Rad9-domain-containing protein n=1 Tax=Meira miltonrushii TaxID=1280837 RepID=A0A316VHE3_9BASI|nr:uncharacterized protein FA14DRAFT_9688 [Meira miltonrushii]PWN37077.1 hypothetical protein FA14DRAFT_9688 [Meira miltonrushii]